MAPFKRAMVDWWHPTGSPLWAALRYL